MGISSYVRFRTGTRPEASATNYPHLSISALPPHLHRRNRTVRAGLQAKSCNQGGALTRDAKIYKVQTFAVERVRP